MVCVRVACAYSDTTRNPTEQIARLAQFTEDQESVKIEKEAMTLRKEQLKKFKTFLESVLEVDDKFHADDVRCTPACLRSVALLACVLGVSRWRVGLSQVLTLMMMAAVGGGR